MASVTTAPLAAVLALRAEVQGLTNDAKSALGAITTTQQALGQMSSAMDEVGQKGDKFAEQNDRVRRQVVETRREVSALDDLYNRVTEAGNVWDEELKLQLELVRIGGQSLQDLMRLWGDAVVATEDGNKKLRELFAGADLRQYTQQIQDLIKGLKDGGTTIAQVLEYLKTNAAQLSKTLVETVEAFRRGETSLERVLQVVEKIKRDYANTDLGDLAKALEEAIRKGNL